jgi:toxin HigB-1
VSTRALVEHKRLNRVTFRVTLHMAIVRFKHKGLEQFFRRSLTVGIQSRHATRLRLVLGRLNVARQPRDMGLPGLNLHPLKGNRAGTWAVTVSANWRVTFAFQNQDVIDVDYEDYH